MVSSSMDWLPAPAIRVVGPGRLEAYVSVPATDEPPEDGWPGLVFLHGNGECANRKTMSQAFLDTGSAHGPLRRVDPELERQLRSRFVIATPQLPGAGGDVWDQHRADIDALVSELLDADHVDATRLSLCGFSYGGNGVIRLADLRRWHALWAVDPPMRPAGGPLPEAEHYRFAFGKYSNAHEAGWLDVLPADRRVIAHHGDEHGRASWNDFGAAESYQGLDR